MSCHHRWFLDLWLPGVTQPPGWWRSLGLAFHLCCEERSQREARDSGGRVGAARIYHEADLGWLPVWGLEPWQCCHWQLQLFRGRKRWTTKFMTQWVSQMDCLQSCGVYKTYFSSLLPIVYEGMMIIFLKSLSDYGKSNIFKLMTSEHWSNGIFVCSVFYMFSFYSLKWKGRYLEFAQA